MKKIICIILLVTILSSMTSCLLHRHTWSEWQTAKEATCTKNGINTRVCDVCGATQSIDIYATGHSYGDWTIIQEVTCTVDGRRERVCTCGEKESVVIAGYHDWDAATCLKPKECAICHKIEGNPLGHTCDIGTCTRCNETLAPIVYLPDLPIESSYRGYSDDATMKITELSYEWVSSNRLRLTISFEKIYDEEGPNAGNPIRFNYRLIDSDGFVVATGGFSFYDYVVGDKVRDKTVEIRLTNSVLNDSTYTLEIIDAGE